MADQIIEKRIAMTSLGFPVGLRNLARRNQVALLAGVLMVFAPSLTPAVHAAERQHHAHEQRHHHAHEHGVSKLKVAIDGPVLEIRLESPGMDIVGFEHAPSTDEDKQAIAKAEEILTAGASLFALSANARCTLLDADVDHPSLSSKPDRHDHGDKHDHQDKDEHQDGHHDEKRTDGEDDQHSAFEAHYRFRCEDIGKLKRIDVKLFEKFPAAKEIEVEAITPAGQVAKELTPSSSRLDL